jgi:hypothetical protein
VSKKHGSRRRKKAKARRNAKARGVLFVLADALNACDDSGATVRLRHGIVMTPGGYVLPMADGRWEARTLNYAPFPLAEDVDGDDD